MVSVAYVRGRFLVVDSAFKVSDRSCGPGSSVSRSIRSVWHCILTVRCISSTAKHTAEMARPMSSVFLSIWEGSLLMVFCSSRSMYIILRSRPQPLMKRNVKKKSKNIGKARGYLDECEWTERCSNQREKPTSKQVRYAKKGSWLSPVPWLV